jgi:hypothetical protein
MILGRKVIRKFARLILSWYCLHIRNQCDATCTPLWGRGERDSYETNWYPVLRLKDNPRERLLRISRRASPPHWGVFVSFVPFLWFAWIKRADGYHAPADLIMRFRSGDKGRMEAHKRAPSRIQCLRPSFVGAFRDHAKIGDLLFTSPAVRWLGLFPREI